MKPTSANEAVLEKRIRFDGTITAGHILTFAGFLGVAASAWTMMDKRVVVLEEARIVQMITDKRQDEERTEIKRQSREDFRAIETKLDRLIDRAISGKVP